MDPIEERGFLLLCQEARNMKQKEYKHPYAFVKNASVYKIDPSGLSIFSLAGVVLLESGVGLEYIITATILHHELCEGTTVGEQWYFQLDDTLGDALQMPSGEWVMIYVYKWKDKKCKIRCIIDINLIPEELGPGPLKPGPENPLRNIVNPQVWAA